MTADRWRIRSRLIELGIEIITAHSLTQFDGAAATLTCNYSGRTQQIEVTEAVLVTQRLQNDTLYRKILDQVDGDKAKLPFTLRRIGDCDAPAIVAAAVYAGHRFAMGTDTEVDLDVPLKHDRVDVGAAGSVIEEPATSAYLETLQLYYEEEIAGEAYFLALSDRVDTAEAAAHLKLLAEVERHCAAIVAPLLAKHGLTPRPTPLLVDEGRADADKGPQTYPEMISYMRKTFPAYIDDFERLESLAPAEDLPVLRRMTEHEVVAVEFLEREAVGAANSAEPLIRYLKTPVDTRGAA